MTTTTTTYGPRTQAAITAGGRVWTSRDGRHRRVYLSRGVGERMVNLQTAHYKSGSISDAGLGGQHISNTYAAKIRGFFDGAYVDVHTDTVEHPTAAPKLLYEVRQLIDQTL